jgi:3-dehydroquinate dehydratase type I
MTLDQIEAQVLQNPYLDRYPFVEIWLDYLEDELPAALALLCCHPALATKSIVFTLRTLDLSEPRRTLKERCDAVALLARVAKDLATTPSASLILDLDIRTQLPELSTFCEIRTTGLPLSLITSYHDFDKTMNLVEFDQVITLMTNYNPQIFKVATYCNTPHDATFLLEAGLRLQDEGRPAVILGMGPHGVATRIFGTLWGNTLCYCPIQTDGRSAPGQYSIDHFQKVFKLLEEESLG